MGKPGDKDTGVLKTQEIQAQFLLDAGQIMDMPKDLSGLVDRSFVREMAGWRS